MFALSRFGTSSHAPGIYAKAVTRLLVFGLASCWLLPAAVTSRPFGKTKDGQAVDIYTLTNKQGMEVNVLTYGGIIQSIKTKDKAGKLGDITLGFETLAGYEGEQPYFGALIGRYGNRIGKGSFTLDGKTYKLAVNNGPNSLHGGLKGFDKVVWKATPKGNGLELRYFSKPMEEGYPGSLDVTVTYTLTEENSFRIDYMATTDSATVLNLTNHTYFNLAGKGTVHKHRFTLSADKFTPVDAGLIPTGELRPVKGTAFDFLTPHEIGERIDAAEEQIKLGGGYDHNFVLQGAMGQLRKVATMEEPTSGRTLTLLTTEPGLQFYTGNFLDGTLKGKGGFVYPRRAAFCFETQHFPDSPNKKAFPTTVLRKGQVFRSSTVFAFGVK